MCAPSFLVCAYLTTCRAHAHLLEGKIAYELHCSLSAVRFKLVNTFTASWKLNTVFICNTIGQATNE